MNLLDQTASAEPWRRRLFLPNYQLAEAAKYARLSSKTVANWHKVGARRPLSERANRKALSYMQLIEVAVVSAFRKAGLTLKHIAETREYVSKQLQVEFPFAEYRFKADGKRLVMDYQQIEGSKGQGKVLRPDQGGQLAWEVIIRRLHEFEYENHGIVIKWRPAGPESMIVIDPRIAFGAPAIKGTPTWVIQGRAVAGESVSEIGDDFDLDEEEVREALAFERKESPSGGKWDA
jgi:uncharacterized protein (DUF433 family)